MAPRAPDVVPALYDELSEDLLKSRGRLADDPLGNPVREVAHRLSTALESGTVTLGDIDTLIGSLGTDALRKRAERARAYVGDLDGTTDGLQEAVRIVSNEFDDWASFKAHWERTHETIVFTGHPTFMHTVGTRRALADLILMDPDTPPAAEALEPITLEEEHAQAITVLQVASESLSSLHRAILQEAKERFPRHWQDLRPRPISLATWVGYDMDGRNDIGWGTVIYHRLVEKSERLARYIEQLSSVPGASQIVEILTRAHTRVEQNTALFAKDLSDPKTLIDAANALTSPKDRLTDIADLDAQLTQLMASAEGDAAATIATVRADINAFGLGLGEIHFRLNAGTIRRSAMDTLGLATIDDLFGRTALDLFSEKIEELTPLRTNFASLASERDAAVRLFIAIAQIIRHIDGTKPIRLLIAECENPVTVLAAIYQAKRFGVDAHVDICPLFETAKSLDRARRILSVLFVQPAFRQQAEQRGCIAIETGFSDAGRFMGQIPAALAIERLHAQFADEMSKHGLSHLDAVVFDTHGESMGRGGHPGGLMDRLTYPLSPWARARFSESGIALRHEQSFQGGDGYIWFTDKRLSDRVVAGLLNIHRGLDSVAPDDDPFYRDASVSLDFFHAVKRRQEELFVDPAYNIALGAMGTALLPTTGSRKTKRQFDHQADEETSLRRIRAIPHNGILQQMGFLANILGGLGEAMAVEPMAFERLKEDSPRFAQLMRLVDRARAGSDMKTFIAYMKLYDGSFWATRPISGKESHLEQACATLAHALSEDGRYFSGLQLAARLRSDSIALHKIMTNMGFDAQEQTGHGDISLDLLHAVRATLIQHTFLYVAQLPRQLAGGAVTRDQLMQHLFALDFDGAVERLKEASTSDIVVFAALRLDEPADYPHADDLPDVTNPVADKLVGLRNRIHAISIAIANHYGAIG